MRRPHSHQLRGLRKYLAGSWPTEPGTTSPQGVESRRSCREHRADAARRTTWRRDLLRFARSVSSLRCFGAAGRAHRYVNLTGSSPEATSSGSGLARDGGSEHVRPARKAQPSDPPRTSIPRIGSREPPREPAAFFRAQGKHAIRSYTNPVRDSKYFPSTTAHSDNSVTSKTIASTRPTSSRRGRGRHTTTPKGAGARAPAPLQGSLQLK